MAGGEITVVDCEKGWDRERKGRENNKEKVRDIVKKEDKMIERREKIIKKLIFSYNISIRTVPSLKRHCSYVPNVLAFDTPHEGGFLVFGVPNAKHLAFGTPNGDALIAGFLFFFIYFYFDVV